MFDMMTETDGKTLIRDRIGTRDWWIVPWTSQHAAALSQAIEERFYAESANADFELVTCHCGVSAVSFARKTRMSARQLARLLIEFGAVGSERTLARALEDQDILVADVRSDAIQGLLAWHAWLGDESARRN